MTGKYAVVIYFKIHSVIHKAAYFVKAKDSESAVLKAVSYFQIWQKTAAGIGTEMIEAESCYFWEDKTNEPNS